MNRITAGFRIFVVSLSFLATACGGLLESNRAPQQIWWLEPLDSGRPPGIADAPSLALDLGVVPGLDTNRILTLSPEARLNHYAGARWADNLPELLRSIFARTLEDSGIFAAVQAREFPAGEECHLQLTARRFYAQLGSDGRTRNVAIDLSGHYDCAGQRRHLALQASVPVDGNRMPEIVGAFQRALDRVLATLLEQLQPVP